MIRGLAKLIQHISTVNTAFRLTTLEDDERDVYISGSFNNWDPGDPRFKLTRIAENKYELKANFSSDVVFPIEYKYVKGDWENEEVTRTGQKTKNRILRRPTRSISDKVVRFRYNGQTTNDRFLPIIETVTDLFLPSLHSPRKINIILPYNYHLTTKRFKVLYLNDGQNLWDDKAPFGSWDLANKLARMSASGKNDLIIVGIDHGGQERIKEFTPINGTRVGRGDGQKYLKDIVETVKPYVDSHYRTKPEREYTGIGGSSMGGLISIYAGIIYPHIFGKLMIFSPSLWIIQKANIESLRFFSPYPTKVYLYSGGKESASMVPAMKRLKQNFEAHDFFDKVLNVKLSIDPNGRHTESKWGREIETAITWLYYNN